MATRIVFSNKLLASHRATSVFADFGSVRVLIERRWRVSPWIVLTLGEDGFAVIREGQDLWSLLDMPKFLNAATAPSWVWWDDQLNPEQFEEALGPETTKAPSTTPGRVSGGLKVMIDHEKSFSESASHQSDAAFWHSSENMQGSKVRRSFS